MRCEAAQRELSVAIHEASPPSGDVRRHAESCPRCSPYASELHRLHQVVRLEPAPDVPDLVPAIMSMVREERRSGPIAPLPADGSRREGRTGGRRAIAAALVAGIVIGFVLGAGGLFPSGPGLPALASEIPHRLVAAATSLRGYHATFEVTERNWSPSVPVRTFSSELWFRAPESFRFVVHDTTTYPSAAWPRNDVELVTDGRTWRARGPNPCPAEELPACRPDSIDRTVMHRAPFDDESPTPTDVIVPMTVLAAQDRVRVLGPDVVGGRAAEAVSLDYENAAPLFAYLHLLGSWRPFYPQDRVVIDLDRSSWFPLRYEVFPARGGDRRLWAAQVGVTGDRPGRPVFTATVGSLSTNVPPVSTFRVPAGPVPFDEGFRDAGARHVPNDMVLPASSGLHPTRFGRFDTTSARPYRESIAAFGNGLTWGTVTRVTGWRQRHLFGVGDFPERVTIRGGSIGYFEPATSTEPRRVALHTARGEYVVATDLPRDRLLALASMLPVRGTEAPGSWFVRRWAGGVVRDGLSPREAVAGATFQVLVPERLPPGYRAAAAESITRPGVRGITLVYRRPAAELDGVGLMLHQAVGEGLSPPQDVSEVAVSVSGLEGRWSPERHLLEWVDHGVYRSLSGPALDLSTLLRVAESLGRPRGPAP